ncbi:STAS domain-containing protein [Nesterenkonia halotolerans]|uniref:Anti-anti-sigma regulatory factor n=1 Tax=Nesterenkonia halotolerans TaxID=225325 RepID=A0ABR9J620_9MICC|nr:STAS domain-containing protein [Nesterenkonia halotolerans]MBE1514430.1 anti-anti-sigma regulatory factor [Nesterenkonia halotolerans]
MQHSSRVIIDAAGLAGPIRLQVLGCLTLNTVPSVTEILDRGAAFLSCPDLVIDLQGLDHLDPVGMAALELYIDQLRSKKGLPKITTSLPALPCDCQAVSS